MKKSQLFIAFLLAAMLGGSTLTFGQVKIGSNPTTIEPISNLEVEASTAGRKMKVDKTTGQVSIVDGTQAEGRILTSDANGAASWKSPFQETANITLGAIANPQNFAFPATGVTYPATYTINAPVTLNKGVYLVYFYFQYSYDVPYSGETSPANLNTWPMFCYTNFTVVSGAATSAVNHPGLIPSIAPHMAAGLQNMLISVTQDNTVLKPVIFGISRKGTVNNAGQIFAIRL